MPGRGLESRAGHTCRDTDGSTAVSCVHDFHRGAAPVAPENLRPGQLGVVMLGRVVVADIAVALVDLWVRDFIQVEKVPGADASGDWSLCPRPATASTSGRGSLLGYEETLLKGLPGQGGACYLSSLPAHVARLLEVTRSAIVRDSVRRGWLRHLDHHQRTEKGEELAGKIRVFRGRLRHFVSGQPNQAVPGELLPYALRFGFMTRDDALPAQFAHAWVEAFADLPGWQAPEPGRSAPEDGPLLNNDDKMSRQIARAAFRLGM